MSSKMASIGSTGAFALIALAVATMPAGAQPPSGSSSLTIDGIDLKPTSDGFYDATVGFVVNDAKLGKTGQVKFGIVVPHVHDADEAIDKVHDPIKTLGDDIQHGYLDIHRSP